MKRTEFLIALTAVLANAAVLGCGDNSLKCGPGTAEKAGVCTAVVGDIMCTDGTRLNADGTACEIDPESCQDGTVLVDGACVDPAHVTPDLEESAEPNGIGIFGEVSSAAGAGSIVIKQPGQSFVIHGKIIPHLDIDLDGQLEPDVDTYVIDLTAPALIDVSADGLHGLSGAFVSLADVSQADPLAAWQRFGLNLSGDTSKRQIYLPAAGRYLLAVTDSRSLFTGAAAASNTPELDFEYYVTVNQLTATPTPLTITDGVATVGASLAPGEVKLFTAAMDLGLGGAVLDIPSDLVTGSLVVSNTSGGTLSTKVVVDEVTDEAAPAPADAGLLLGFRAGDTTTIVVDHAISFASSPVEFDLIVTTAGSGELSRTGGTVAQPESATDFSTFFYDVASNLETTGFDISFDQTVSGVILFENGGVFSLLTFDPDPLFGGFATMTDYRGLFRHPVAGRYYWLTFEPTGGGATAITTTSTIAAVTPTPVVPGTPLATVAIDPDFQSNALTYAAGTVDAWQQFTASGANSSTITGRFFDPATTFGRLDDLATGCIPFCNDTFPVFQHTYTETGTTRGRILIDDLARMGNSSYFVTVNTATTAADTTFSLDFTRRAHTDLATLAAGSTDTKLAQPLSDTITVQRYLVRTQRDNEVSVTVDPAAITLNTQIQAVNNDESPRGAAANDGIAGNDPDSTQQYQRGDGWTAWVVSPVLPLATPETFDQTATIVPARYNVATTATAFADACTGGSVVTTSNPDDALSGVLDAPAGFDLFGVPSPQLKVSTNGWLTFRTAETSNARVNADMPTAGNPQSVVAPYWDDLDLVRICTKTQGTKLIVQWTGVTFDFREPVAFQAILDGADDTIEFVYGSDQQASGSSATIGIENATGTKSKVISVNASAITAASSRKLTANP